MSVGSTPEPGEPILSTSAFQPPHSGSILPQLLHQLPPALPWWPLHGVSGGRVMEM